MAKTRILSKSIGFAALIGGVALLPLQAGAADLSGEIANAAQHAGLAAQASDIAGVHTHLHHTVNCLVGPSGSGFDAKELNPCANSGNGAIPDAVMPAEKKALQAAAAKAETGIASANYPAAQKIASDTAAMLNAVK
jgi:hypothetical protein